MKESFFVIFLLILVVLMSGCIDTKYLENISEALGETKKQPTEETTTTTLKVEEPEPIPEGSIALFFTTRLGEVKNRLPARDRQGRVTNIRWESSTSAVIRYLPKLDRVDVMKTGGSYSYSKKSMYPYTTAGRFFVVSDWGSDWAAKKAQWTLSEINPLTGERVSSDTGFHAISFAVVGDKLYFSSPIVKDFYGRVKGGGELKVMNLGEGSSYNAKLLPSSSRQDGGILYGVGDHLLSVLVNYSVKPKTLSIRQHDLGTGAMKTLYAGIPSGDLGYSGIFPGYNALYHLVKTGKTIQIHRYPVSGQPEALLEVELDENEESIYVGEDNGTLLILVSGKVPQKGYRIVECILYDLETKEIVELQVEPFPSLVSFSRIGVPFLVLG